MSEPERAQPRVAPPSVVIRPARGWMSFPFQELWNSRELLYFLAWRDIKVRYKQTAIGAAWAILQPLLFMVVFSVFFGRLAKVPSDGFPYPLFAFCALLPWQLFAYALTHASTSLVVNERLITKVYFPRLLVPASVVLAGLMDFAIAFVFLIGLLLWYGFLPGAAVLALPLFLLMALTAALGAGLWLSALDVQYRDVRYTIPFLTQCWLFATPIAYPSSLVPESWRALYGLNPMVGVVEGFRWALLGSGTVQWSMIAVSATASAVLLITGLVFFRRMEDTIADVI